MRIEHSPSHIELRKHTQTPPQAPHTANISGHAKAAKLKPSSGSRSFFARLVTQHFAAAGISINGPHAHDLQVNDPRFYARAVMQGSLGLGESYMAGYWDTGHLEELMYRLLKARLDESSLDVSALWIAAKARLFNLQSRHRSEEVGRRHYDLGNDFYRAMLGRRLVYSCGYWRQARDLDSAQEAKLDLVCRKLMLHSGMRALDIGCGWGEALKFAAERYGIEGVGVTISREQAGYARKLCAGLPIKIRLCDYRDIDERFDRILSIGMFEHVGVDHYANFFRIARRCLTADGLFLLHTIGGERSSRHTDPWIAKYVFPNSMLPSAAQLTQALEGRFVIEDWHNFGIDYVPTLRAWRDNIEQAWPSLPPRYDETFHRLWRYYLATAAALFRSRRGQLWQLVLSPQGVARGYVAPR